MTLQPRLLSGHIHMIVVEGRHDVGAYATPANGSERDTPVGKKKKPKERRAEPCDHESAV